MGRPLKWGFFAALVAMLFLGLGTDAALAKGQRRQRVKGRKANTSKRASAQRGPGRHERNQLRNGTLLTKPVTKPSVVVRGTARNQGLIAKHLKHSASMLRRYGIGKAKLGDVAQHIALGLPSNAARNHNDYLLARNEYVMSYSRDLVGPRWVSWRVRPSNVNGGVRRKDRFRADVSLPDGWPRATKDDYRNSGWTRGHLVASLMRTSSRRANSKTFVLTNIIPQAVNNNSGPWAHLEDHYVDLASKGHVVHAIAGGVYSEKPKRIGENKIAVPTATWKMLVVLEKGQTIHDINEKTRVISVLIPNSNKKVHKQNSYEQYLVSPRVIEQQTGLKMLRAVPEEIRRVLLDRVDNPKISPSQVDPRVQQRTRKALARIQQQRDRQAAKLAKKRAARIRRGLE